MTEIDYTELSELSKRALESYLGCKSEPEKINCKILRSIKLQLDQKTVSRLAQISMMKEQSISQTILEAIQLFFEEYRS